MMNGFLRISLLDHHNLLFPHDRSNQSVALQRLPFCARMKIELELSPEGFLNALDGRPELEGIEITNNYEIDVAVRPFGSLRHRSEDEGQFNAGLEWRELTRDQISDPEGFEADRPQVWIDWVSLVRRVEALVATRSLQHNSRTLELVENPPARSGTGAADRDQFVRSVLSLWVQQQRGEHPLLSFRQ